MADISSLNMNFPKPLTDTVSEGFNCLEELSSKAEFINTFLPSKRLSAVLLERL